VTTVVTVFVWVKVVPVSVTTAVVIETTVVGVGVAVTVVGTVVGTAIVGRLNGPSDSVNVSVIGLPLITVTIREGEGVEEMADGVAGADADAERGEPGAKGDWARGFEL